MTAPMPIIDVALPVRFDGRDLVASADEDVRARTAVRLVLFTEPGELPWRTDFGAGLGRLRHRRIDAVDVEVLRVQLRDAFRTWLSAAWVIDVNVDQRDAASDAVTIEVGVGTRAVTVTVAP